MTTHFLEEAALLAHEAMKLGESPAFKEIAVPGLSHPGFIGAHYVPDDDGILIIGMNRGGAAQSVVDPIETECLRKLHKGPNTTAMRVLSERCFQILRNWNLWDRNLLILLDRVGFPINRVAYIHAIPFRVTDNNMLADLYRPVWDAFTKRQYELYRPSRVLFAGKAVGNHLSDVVQAPSRTIPRTGRDIARPSHAGTSHAQAVAKAHDILSEEKSFWSWE